MKKKDLGNIKNTINNLSVEDKTEIIRWLSKQSNGNGRETLYNTLLKDGLSELVGKENLEKYIIKPKDYDKP